MDDLDITVWRCLHENEREKKERKEEKKKKKKKVRYGQK